MDIAHNLEIIRAQREENIIKNGWALMGIFADEEFPSYGYTTGLSETYGHPEIIMVGIPIEAIAALVESIVKLLDKGEKIDTTKKYGGIAAGLDVCFISVEERYRNKYMLACVERYGDVGFTAIQMVWPDQENLFPWEEGHNNLFDKSQPLLGI